VGGGGAEQLVPHQSGFDKLHNATLA